MMKKLTLFLLMLMLFCAPVLAQDLPRIAVYVTGNVPEDEKSALGTRMLASLVNSGRYRGIERSTAFLAEIEREHVKQRSGAIDDGQIRDLGRQFGVKFVCIAAITPAFGSYQVSARIVDVETAEVVFIGDAASPLRTIDDLTQVSHEVVRAMFGKQAETRQTQQQITSHTPASVVQQADKTSVEYGRERKGKRGGGKLKLDFESQKKNAVVVDVGLILVGLAFNWEYDEGFGFGLQYERMLSEKFSVMGRYDYLTWWWMPSRYMTYYHTFGAYARYYPTGRAFFLDGMLGYGFGGRKRMCEEDKDCYDDSYDYFKLGSMLGWKIKLGENKRFIWENSLGWHFASVGSFYEDVIIGGPRVVSAFGYSF